MFCNSDMTEIGGVIILEFRAYQLFSYQSLSPLFIDASSIPRKWRHITTIITKKKYVLQTYARNLQHVMNNAFVCQCQYLMNTLKIIAHTNVRVFLFSDINRSGRLLVCISWTKCPVTNLLAHLLDVALQGTKIDLPWFILLSHVDIRRI